MISIFGHTAQHYDLVIQDPLDAGRLSEGAAWIAWKKFVLDAVCPGILSYGQVLWTFDTSLI